MTKFHGSACKRCGGTERWSANKTCVVCGRRRGREAHASGYRRVVDRRRWKDWYLRRNYGLTVEQYERMLVDQDGKCAICCSPPPDEKDLCVDHNHCTGLVRALLCDACNTTLGQLGEDPARLRAAADYLERYHAPRAA